MMVRFEGWWSGLMMFKLEDVQAWKCLSLKMMFKFENVQTWKSCPDLRMMFKFLENDVQVWGCLNLKMFRFENVQVWECLSLTMFKLENVQTWECSSLRMFKFEDVQAWGCSKVRRFKLSFVGFKNPTWRSPSVGKKYHDTQLVLRAYICHTWPYFAGGGFFPHQKPLKYKKKIWHMKGLLYIVRLDEAENKSSSVINTSHIVHRLNNHQACQIISSKNVQTHLGLPTARLGHGVCSLRSRSYRSILIHLLL